MTPNALLSALSTEIEEDPRYLTEQIVTYLGNKRSLLNFLGRGLKYVKARLGKEQLKAGDLVFRQRHCGPLPEKTFGRTDRQ